VANKYGIDNLGESNAILQNQQGSAMDMLLLNLTNEVCNRLREGLKKHDVNTSSLGLSQSIQPTEVSHKGKEVTIGISAENYWKFINYGVNGTERSWGAPAWGSQGSQPKSFHQSILEWIPKRGVQLPSQFKDYDSFAWAIQKNIIKKGKEPKPFFSEVVNNKLADYMRPQIEELLGQAITINIVAPWQ
jgi:hypothetical protein